MPLPSPIPSRAVPARAPAPIPLLPLVLCGVLAGSALLAGCGRRPDDPALELLRGALRPGDRLLLLRVLDPGTGDRIAAVVAPGGARPQLRFYEKSGGGPYALVHTEQQGDAFGNLSVEDVNADGREEVLASWSGGHLETLEVLRRDDAGAWTTLFLNAGRQIEKRYDPAGRVEFFITSRTYEEAPGQPPAYATSIFRWDGARFSESRRP